MTTRSRVFRAARRALAALTLALAAVLIWAVLDIFLTGQSLQQTDPSAAIFSRAAAAARLPAVLTVFGLWLAALIAALAARPAGGTRKRRPQAAARPSRSRGEAAAGLSRPAAGLRWALLALALALIVLGVLNGGLRDAFIKAANICTECIGLG